MKELDDYDIMIAERDEDYARRIELEVQHLEQEFSARNPIGNDDITAFDEEYDDKYESEVDDDQPEEPEERRERDPKLILLWMTGEILLARGFRKYYGQMVIVAALFLLSIIVMFWSLHLDMEYNAVQRDVQLLRERSIRLHEIRVSRTSHSQVVEELERRGIKIEDPTRPATMIEKKRW